MRIFDKVAGLFLLAVSLLGMSATIAIAGPYGSYCPISGITGSHHCGFSDPGIAARWAWDNSGLENPPHAGTWSYAGMVYRAGLYDSYGAPPADGPTNYFWAAYYHVGGDAPTGPSTGPHPMHYLSYLNPSKFYLEIPSEDPDTGIPKLCLVGNPIHPKTGNKFQAEPLYASPSSSLGASAFSFYYNSLTKAIPSAVGANWQHTYQRTLRQIKETPLDYPPPPNIIRSAEFSTPMAACTSGWNQVKSTLTERWVQSAVAPLTGDDRCTITSAGTVWKTLPIRAVSPEVSYSTSFYTELYLLTRADGRTLEFRKNNGLWRNEADLTDKLDEITDATGVRTGWRYTSSNDEVELYDTTGKLLSITTRAGLTQTLSYDATQRLVAVADAFGRTLTFAYDANNRISTMTDPAGSLYGYSYDANNNLAVVTYPDGKVRTYLYENTVFPHALTGILDENGSRFAT